VNLGGSLNSGAGNPLPPCPRCGSEIDLSPEKIAAIVAETPIAPSLAADEKLYKKRLDVCGHCEALRESVLCAYCGCFILFRARPKKSYCPHPKGDLWANITL
jgi:hypothetical protein